MKVPYRGTAPQVTHLIAGHVQLGSADYPTAGPHFRDGKRRPLLVMGRARLAELPGMPTTAELGLTEADFTIWNGFFAPTATPTPIVERLREGLALATRSGAFCVITDGNGKRAVLQTGAEVTARLQPELDSRRASAREIGPVAR